MNILISKFLQPGQNIEEELKRYKGKQIQLGFYQPSFFESLNHREIAKYAKDQGINIPTVHAPTIDLTEEKRFFSMLKILKEAYGINILTLHAGSENPHRLLKKHEQFSERILDLDLLLAYENFDENPGRKWVARSEGIFRLPFSHCMLTYDSSHVPASRTVSEDFEFYYAKLVLIHLSNRRKEGKGKLHRPWDDGDHDLGSALQFLRRRAYPGHVILEYAPDHEQKALDDYEKLGGKSSC